MMTNHNYDIWNNADITMCLKARILREQGNTEKTGGPIPDEEFEADIQEIINLLKQVK